MHVPTTCKKSHEQMNEGPHKTELSMNRLSGKIVVDISLNNRIICNFTYKLSYTLELYTVGQFQLL